MEIGESCGVASLCSSSLSCPARRTVGAGRKGSVTQEDKKPPCTFLSCAPCGDSRDLGILGVCVCDSRDLGILRLVGAFALCTSALPRTRNLALHSESGPTTTTTTTRELLACVCALGLLHCLSTAALALHFCTPPPLVALWKVEVWLGWI